MKQQIHKLLAPPVFAGDEEKTRVASLLNGILLITIGMMLVIIIALLLTEPTPVVLLMNLSVLVVPLSLEFVMRRGYVKEAATLFIIVIWLFISAITYFADGLSPSIITSYFLLIVLAGVLSGPRMVVLVTAITLLAIGSIEWLDQNGLLPEPLTPYNPVTDAIGTASNMLFMAAVMYVTMKNLNKTMALQQESNRALRQYQATLEDRVARRTRDLAASAEISRALSTMLDTEQIVSEMARQIQAAFGYESARLYLVDAEQQTLTLAGTARASHAALPPEAYAQEVQEAVEQAVSHNKVVLRPDDGQPPAGPNEAALPLSVGGDVSGALYVRRAAPHTLAQGDVEMLRSLASQIAAALRNARLFQEAESQAVQESQLNIIGRKIQQAMDVDTTLQVAAQELGRALGARRVSVQIGNRPQTNGRIADRGPAYDRSK